MSDIVIEAKGLTKRYGAAYAVNGASFNVAAGEIFGLLGPNGAGKTTTILMLLGLSDISAGEARVFGHDPTREPLAVKRLVGYLPDSVGFYDNLTAAENLHYTARLMGFASDEREKRIAAALKRVGLREVANKKVATFSSGMRQRLGLAEIVMKDARVAILDEPTNGLDPQASIELLELIRSLKASGVSVLVSSHMLERVQSVCDRVALFNAGRIVLMGTVGELGRQVLGGGYAVEVEADGGDSLAKRLSLLGGVRSVEQPSPGRFRMACDRDLRAEAAAAVVAAGGRLKQLALDQPSLETIYTRYFQNAQEARHAA
jgi:ABC-2 type transport system ATP-binding protein